MNDYNFGNFLYEVRSEKGLSQSQLGQMLGVTNKAVSKWENGSAKPNTNLIPKIAEIFGVTVEELFAGKRIKKESELTKLKEYIGSLKKKYAILSSIYFGILVSVPFLLIEFICVVNGFHINDEVLGPLGAVGINVVFIVSLSAFIIYTRNYKNVSFCNAEFSNSDFSIRVLIFRNVTGIVSLISVLLMLITLFIFFNEWWGPYFLSYRFEVGVYYAVIGFLFTISFGIFCCCWRTARLLKIENAKCTPKRKAIRISELPRKWKICYIAALSALCLNAVVKFAEIWLPWLIYLRAVLLLAGSCLLIAVIIKMNKKDK